jgi:AcrR family transcriptional regulator
VIFSQLSDWICNPSVMSMTKGDNRKRLIRAAQKMAFRHGFYQTTLADIAKEARVPLGNIYYYFKTKDEIGRAVIQEYFLQLRANSRYWEEAGTPRDRLCARVDTVAADKDEVAKRGCKIGTLCSELNKGTGATAREACALLAEHVSWIEAQFREMGKAREARSLAIHLFAALQGAAVLALTLIPIWS